MDYVSEDGTVVPCSNCGMKNTFKEPVSRGQVFICHSCRQRQQIRTFGGKLKGFPLVDIYSMHKKPDKAK
jgi:hypothetical protein